MRKGETDKVVSIIRDNPEQINMLGYSKVHPFHIAATHNTLYVIELLKYVDINIRHTVNNSTALHFAVLSKHLNDKDKAEIIQLLIDNKADINAKNITDNTPLDYAFIIKSDEIVKLLTSQGAKIGFPIENNQNASNYQQQAERTPTKEETEDTPLTLAIKNKNDKEFYRLVEQNPEMLTAPGYKGWLPLNVAAGYGIKYVKALVEKGVEIHSLNGQGQIPVFDTIVSTYISQQEKIEICKYLIDHKADINLQDKYGLVPIHYAVAKESKEIIQLLLNKNAKIDSKDGEGFTSLHYAAQKSYKAIIEILLNNKADINAKNVQGLTPLDFAKYNGHREIVEYMLNHNKTTNSEMQTATSGNEVTIVIEMLPNIRVDDEDVNPLGEAHIDPNPCHTQ